MKTTSIRMAVVTVLLPSILLFTNPGLVIAETVTQPVTYGSSTTAICLSKPADDRATRLNSFFADRNMPLAGYGDELVAAADKYALDWRLVAAIGIRESSGGKHLMNNNPFGWGSAKIPFKNFSEAIVEVTKNLAGADEDTAKYYKDRTLEKKLWFYNGSVMPEYTGEVIAIMNRF